MHLREQVVAVETLYFDVTHGPVEVARPLVARLDRAAAAQSIRPLVSARLDDQASDWEGYRRMGGVLSQLHLFESLSELVSRARRWPDEDSLEVAEDYSSSLDPAE